MTDEETIDVHSFGASFKGFMEQMVQQAPTKEPELLTRARAHFGSEPATLPVVSEEFARHEHPNLHLAIEEFLGRDGRASELFGVTVMHEMFGLKLSKLFAPSRGAMGEPASIGPVEYHNLTLGDGRVLACVSSGLYFVREGERALAILISAPRERHFGGGISAQVMAADREHAESVLAELRNTMRARSVYRGRIISLESNREGGVDVKFHRLPSIARDEIILPAGTLDRIERQTVRFSELKSDLVRMGRHLKRGVLLHGPPGTGKTLTAMYLASRMPDRTVLLLTGRTLGLIEQSCAMARLLQPATVILEDVDLIAEERSRQQGGCNVILFELLNQMDGLADDADVLFLLTTNRADILEPALASRPGRIDQAIEVPLPDEDCRARLLRLYGRGLSVSGDEAGLVRRLEGVSASFIRELLRRAALFAADEGTQTVADRHLDIALQELAVDGGKLTRSLLGASGLAAQRAE